MTIAAIFIITNRSEQPLFPLKDEWINEMLHKHTMEYYSALFFFFVVNFVIHWNETAMGLHVFPIPIPPPTSLSTRSP